MKTISHNYVNTVNKITNKQNQRHDCKQTSTLVLVRSFKLTRFTQLCLQSAMSLRAAMRVFFISIATVMGPTPPGTGVM